MEQNITTIIFDMDGTLIDSEPIYLRETKQFLAHYDIVVDIKEINSVIGRDTDFFWKQMQKWMNNQYTIGKIKSLYQSYELEIDYEDLLFPHVHRMLSTLQMNQFNIVLASASPAENIQQVLGQCKLQKYFDYVISGEQVKNNKPAPDIYLKVLEDLNLSPEEVIIVEDSTNGLQAALQTGAVVIAKEDTRYQFEQSKAKLIIADLLELLTLLNI